MKKIVLLFAIAPLAVLVTAASAQSGSGQIQGCYGTQHILKIKSPCNRKESTLTWNVQGPAGAQGATGPQGATGAAGATGPQGASDSTAFTRKNEVLAAPTGTSDQVELCPTGTRVSGGGYDISSASGLTVKASYPHEGPLAFGTNFSEWDVAVLNTSGTEQPVTVYVICS